MPRPSQAAKVQLHVVDDREPSPEQVAENLRRTTHNPKIVRRRRRRNSNGANDPAKPYARAFDTNGNRRQTWGPKKPKPRTGEKYNGRTPAFNSGGSRICGAPKEGHTAQGAECQRQAGFGTKHLGWGWCGQHGGNTVRGERLAEIQRATAEHVRRDKRHPRNGNAERFHVLGDLYDMAKEITPEQVLEEELWRANGALAQLAEQLGHLTPAELEMLPEGRVLLDMYRYERGSATKIAKMMIDIGFTERQTASAEIMAMTIAAVITSVLQQLELTPEQSQKAPQIMRAVLERTSRQIGSGEDIIDAEAEEVSDGSEV